MPRKARTRERTRPAPRRSHYPDQLRRVGVVILALKLALVPIVFDPGALIVFALPKTVVSESLSAGLVGVLVLLTMREGARWLRTPVITATLVLLASYVVAAAFAQSHYLAVVGSHDRLLGLLAAADMTVTTLALIAIPRAEDLRLLVRAAIAGGVVACA